MGASPTVTQKKTWKQRIFGTDLKSPKAWSVLTTRLAIGFLFLWGGYEKMADTWGGLLWPGTAKTSATTGFLKYAASGPFAGFFNGLAGNVAVEYLLVYGELLIGVSIMLGIFSRIGAISGVAMNLLFYLSQLPVEHNPIVNEYVIYMAVFGVLFFVNPGRFLGLDGIVQTSQFVQDRPSLKKLLARLG